MSKSCASDEASQDAELIHCPSVFDEARKKYTHILANEYKFGTNGKLPDKMEIYPCDCRYDAENPDMACGDASDCINRALLIECSEDDCVCGLHCGNRRFQRCQYAPIEIFKTDKKGFGLRALDDIKPGQFIIEYCGEVIPNHVFAKRVRDYADEGVEHFYFMTLKNDEIIDAQKKGNWSRFMNHSCNPNCLLQKWVVAGGLRVGMFAIRPIAKGAELNFDYKFERYGDKAQACFCGEPNCKGMIGGEQKAEIIEYEDDYYEIDDDAYAKSSNGKQRRKTGDIDDAYDEKRPEKPIQSVADVQKVVKNMLYFTSKPYHLKRMLSKLELTQDVLLLRRFLQYHGLLVLKSCINIFLKANDILTCNQVLVILNSLPIASRNSITDSKIDDYVQKLTDVNEMHTAMMARELLDSWQGLQVIYRIPKRKPGELSSPQKKSIDESTALKVDTTATEGNNEYKALIAQELQTTGPSISYRTAAKDRSLSGSVDDARSEYSREEGRSEKSYSSSPRKPALRSPELTAPRAAAKRNWESTRNDSDSDESRKRLSTSISVPKGESSDSDHEASPKYENVYSSEDEQKVNEASKDLPESWRVAVTENGDMYYYNMHTKESSWFPPGSTTTTQHSEEEKQRLRKERHKKRKLMKEKRRKEKEQRRLKQLEAEKKRVSMDMQIDKPDSNGHTVERKDSEKTLERGSSFSSSKLSAEFRSQASQVVVKFMSRYRDKFENDQFKTFARKYTHQIMEKEEKASTGPLNEVNDEIKRKIKKFLTMKLKEQGIAVEDAAKPK